MRIIDQVVSSSGALAKGFGNGTVDLAKGIGSGSVSLARRIGVKRALIGVAAIGAVAGAAVVLVRFLKARAEDEHEEIAPGVTRRKPNAKKRDRQGHAIHH